MKAELLFMISNRLRPVSVIRKPFELMIRVPANPNHKYLHESTLSRLLSSKAFSFAMLCA